MDARARHPALTEEVRGPPVADGHHRRLSRDVPGDSPAGVSVQRADPYSVEHDRARGGRRCSCHAGHLIEPVVVGTIAEEAGESCVVSGVVQQPAAPDHDQVGVLDCACQLSAVVVAHGQGVESTDQTRHVGSPGHADGAGSDDLPEVGEHAPQDRVVSDVGVARSAADQQMAHSTDLSERSPWSLR